MHASDVPVPARVRLLRRDDRGYPVPVVVPWDHGVPQFSQSSWERQVVVMIEQRCGICGLPLADTDTLSVPVFHVVSEDAIDPLAAELAGGNQVVADTVEAPGHRSCMIYAAATCPYLGNATARRRQSTDNVRHLPLIPAGQHRGRRSAVAGFSQYLLETAGEHYCVQLSEPTELHVYHDGSELLELLTDAIADDAPTTAEPPRYLYSDAAVLRRLRTYASAVDATVSSGAPATAAGQIPAALRGPGDAR